MVDLNCITLPCQPSPPAPQSSDAMSDYSFSYMLRARDLNFVYVSESVTEVLGFEIHDLVNRDLSMDILFHEQEKEHAVRTLNETARNDKVACLVYLQLYHNTRGFVDCVMTQSAVNDGSVIAGSISLAASGAAGATARNQSAEEVILITESAQAPGNARSINWNWNGPRRPRSAFLLDRFSVDCTITHCTNAAILDPETCVNHPGGIYRYVAQRDEEAVRGFIAELKRHGIGAGHGIFSYLDFTMCTTGRDLRTPSRNGTPPRQDEVSVSVVGSATSDGLILVVRRNN